MRISDWSSDVCSSDLRSRAEPRSRRCRSADTGGAWSLSNPGCRTAACARRQRRCDSQPHARFGDWHSRSGCDHRYPLRSEEHTSELQSLMRISYAVFCLKKNNTTLNNYSRKHKFDYYTQINYTSESCGYTTKTTHITY